MPTQPAFDYSKYAYLHPDEGKTSALRGAGRSCRGLLSRYPDYAFLTVAYLLGAFFLARFYVFADGVDYFGQLRNMYIGSPGLAASVSSLGPAVLWLPFFALGHAATHAANALLGTDLLYNGDTFFYIVFTSLGSLVYGYLGLVFLYKLLKGHFSRPVALFTATAMLLGTQALGYVYGNLYFSHVFSWFTVALFLFHWDATRGSRSWRRWAFVGLLAGMMTMARWQNLVFCLLPFCEWAGAMAKEPSRGRMFALGALFAACLLAGFFPQMYLWKLKWGSFLTLPQGQGFMLWTDPKLLLLYFSPTNGMFFWHPLLVLAAVGLILFAVREPRLGLVLIAAVLIQSYVCSVVLDWSGSHSFGARRMTNLLPFFALGLGELLNRFRHWGLKAVVILLVAWNVVYFCQFHSDAVDSFHVRHARVLDNLANDSAPGIMQYLSLAEDGAGSRHEEMKAFFPGELERFKAHDGFETPVEISAYDGLWDAGLFACLVLFCLAGALVFRSGWGTTAFFLLVIVATMLLLARGDIHPRVSAVAEVSGNRLLVSVGLADEKGEPITGQKIKVWMDAFDGKTYKARGTDVFEGPGGRFLAVAEMTPEELSFCGNWIVKVEFLGVKKNLPVAFPH